MTRIVKSLFLVGVALGLLSIPAKAVFVSRAQSGTAEAIAISTRFYDLIGRGDSAAGAQLLAPDVVVLESGDFETRAEYLAHHIGADIEFAKAVPSKRTIRQVVRQGNVIWVAATSTSNGQFENRAINSSGAELMVLTKLESGWRIRAIHWSSHRNQPAK